MTTDPVLLEETTLEIKRLDKPESAVIVTLTGFLQRREANKVTKAINTLQDEGVDKIIFDLAEVVYANSSAIGAFVNCASSLKAGGGQTVLMAMRPNIRKVFDTLGLTGLFCVVATKDEAIEAVS